MQFNLMRGVYCPTVVVLTSAGNELRMEKGGAIAGQHADADAVDDTLE